MASSPSRCTSASINGRLAFFHIQVDSLQEMRQEPCIQSMDLESEVVVIELKFVSVSKPIDTLSPKNTLRHWELLRSFNQGHIAWRHPNLARIKALVHVYHPLQFPESHRVAFLRFWSKKLTYTIREAKLNQAFKFLSSTS